MAPAPGDGRHEEEREHLPVFISYARGANLAQARALHAELSGKDEQAFLDESDIAPGERFPRVLAEALLASRVVVVFASEAYFRRWYCLWELETVLGPFLALWEGAEEREKEAALAPVLIALPAEGEAVPELSSLPPLLQKSNWLRAGDTAGLASLIRARLAASARTLGERLEASGQVGARLRSRLLEEEALRPPRSLAGVQCYPRELPPSLGTSFVGREDDLWRIHHALSVLQDMRGEGATGAALAAAVTGAGGFGKTRLVLEYLHRFGPSHYPGGLFWVNADVPEDRLEEQFHGALRTLKPEVPELMAFRESKRNAAAELAGALDEAASKQRVLYVVDNVPEVGPDEAPRPLRTWCPALGKVSLLITSRASLDLGAEEVQELPLTTLTPKAAVTLLTDRIGRKGLGEPDWSQIAQWVGFLPLTLELLNRALRAGVRPESLLSRARDQGPVEELERQMKVLRRHVPAGALRGIAEALSISYERLSEEEQMAARLIAWLAPEPIPWKLLEALGPEVSSEEVYTTLLSRHFVTPVGEDSGRMFGVMHRVLADYLRTQSAEPLVELRQVCRGLIQVMEPSAGRDPRAWTLMDACRPHAESIFGRLTKKEATSEVEGAIQLGLRLGYFLSSKGLAKQAQGIDKQVVDLTSRNYGAEHPDTLAAMNNLAEALRQQGDFQGALEYLESVMEVNKRVLGEEHPDTLAAMNNLAEALRGQGKLEEARAYQVRGVEASTRVLGAEHPRTLAAMNNLAVTLREQWDLEGAREYQMRVLEVNKRLRGEENPATLAAMNNLAVTLFKQGELEGAREYQKRVVEVSKHLLGKDHPDTLAAMNNLAETLLGQGNLEEARGYLEPVLAVSKRTMGEEHPSTLVTMDCLARTLRAQGDFQRARGYQEQLLKRWRQVGGEEHPATLVAMNNLIATLRAQGDLIEARGHMERAVDISKRLLGEEHPDTLAAMNNLGETLRKLGDLAGSRKHLERALAVCQRVLGEDDSNTLVVMTNLINTLREQGDWVGVRENLEQLLKIWQRVLGEDHPNTLVAMGNLAEALRALGDLAGARGYLERMLEVSKRVLGEGHPTTMMAMNNLIATIRAQGDWIGLRGYMEQLLNTSRRMLGEEHPATLMAMSSLALLLYALGDFGGARGYQARVLEVSKRVLGEEHPATLTAMRNLEMILDAQRKQVAAEAPQQEH